MYALDNGRAIKEIARHFHDELYNVGGGSIFDFFTMCLPLILSLYDSEEAIHQASKYINEARDWHNFGASIETYWMSLSEKLFNEYERINKGNTEGGSSPQSAPLSGTGSSTLGSSGGGHVGSARGALGVDDIDIILFDESASSYLTPTDELIVEELDPYDPWVDYAAEDLLAGDPLFDPLLADPVFMGAMEFTNPMSTSMFLGL